MSVDGSSDGIQDITSLFSGGREITSDAGELFRSLECTKAARYFEPDLDHTNILLGKVVEVFWAGDWPSIPL